MTVPVVPKPPPARPGGWRCSYGQPDPDCSFPDGSAEAGDRLLGALGCANGHTAFGTTEFQLPYGQWVRVLHEAGFTLERLEELQAPEGASTPWPFVDAAWAHRWPSECVWVARKRTT